MSSGMKYFGSIPFLELVPPSIAWDKTISDAANALDGFIVDSAKAIPNILLFARLAHDSGFINPVPMLPSMTRLTDLSGGLKELEPYLLDLLAWQLHVESYDAGISLQAKREMIQASLLLHRRNGTPWSVRHALETLLRVPATVPEWFNYGGKPYFFRARLDVTGVYVDLRWLLSAFQIIMDYKNVRSWLEWLETFATIEMEERVGVGVCGNVKEREMLYFPNAPMPEMISRVGVGMACVTRVEISLNFTPPLASAAKKTGIGLESLTRAQTLHGGK